MELSFTEKDVMRFTDEQLENARKEFLEYEAKVKAMKILDLTHFDDIKSYHNIGSVVKLKDSNYEYIIMGRFLVFRNDKAFDYLVTRYPCGFYSLNKTHCVNNADIAEVVYEAPLTPNAEKETAALEAFRLGALMKAMQIESMRILLFND